MSTDQIDKRERALRLKEEGLSLRAVGRELGISGERVRQILEGEACLQVNPQVVRRTARVATVRERLERGGETLEDAARAAGVSCETARRYVAEEGIALPVVEVERRWTREKLLDAGRRWIAAFDRSPTSTDWSPAMARKTGHPEAAERHAAGDWPYTTRVVEEWPAWLDFIRALGETPLPAGYRFVVDADGRAVRENGERVVMTLGGHARRPESTVRG